MPETGEDSRSASPNWRAGASIVPHALGRPTGMLSFWQQIGWLRWNLRTDFVPIRLTNGSSRVFMNALVDNAL